MAINFEITADHSAFIDSMRKMQDAVRRTTKTISSELDATADAVVDLTNQVNTMANELNKAEKSGDSKAIEEKRRKLKELEEELAATKKEFVDLSKVFSQPQPESGGTQSMRSRLRELTMEVSELTMKYRSMTETERNSAAGRELEAKIRRLTKEASDLSDTMGDVKDAIKNAASDTSTFDSLAGGINVATSAMGGLTGAAAMLGVEESELQDIQTRLQASLAISNALSVIQNNLQEQSALMLGVRKVQEGAAAMAIRIRSAAEGKSIIVTKAATVAQRAFNLVAKANPYVLLATAILTVVGALAAFTLGTKKQTQAEEAATTAAKKHAEAQAEANRVLGESVGNVVAEYELMRTQWRQLSSEQEKAQWIAANASKFQQMGWSINSVIDAERFFVEMTPSVVAALKARAEAKAYEELYKEAVKKKVMNDTHGTVDNGRFIYTPNYNKRDPKEERLAGLTDEDYTYHYKPFTYAKERDGYSASGMAKLQAYRNKNAARIRQQENQEISIYEQGYIDAQEKANKADEQLRKGGLTPYKGGRGGGGGGRGGGGRGGSGGGKSWDAEAAAAERDRLMTEWGEELEELIYDVQQDIADATVEALDESTEKTLKKLDEDEKKELHAIKEQREELIENRRKLDLNIWEKTAQGNNEGNFKAKTNEEYLQMIEAEQPGLLAALAKREKQIAASYAKQRKEVQDAELAVMRDYLKEYGDIEQQRLAITEEYAEKIAKAQNPYEKASLALQRDQQLEGLDSKAAEEKINWGGVFSSLEGHTKQYLEGLRDQLQSLLNSGDLPVDQLAVVQEKLREVNDALSQQSDMLSFVGERTREHNRLLQEQADAEKLLDAANAEQVAAENNLTLARKRFSEGKGSQEEVLVAEAKLRDARKKTADATIKAEQTKDAAAEEAADKIAGKFADAAEWVNTYLGDLPGLLEKLGLGSASEKAQMGIDAVNDAAGAAADFASGNYVGAALKAFNALDNLGNIIGVGGLSDPKLEQDIERLTQSNENLQKAIYALAEELSDASVLDVKDIYEQQRKMLEQNVRNTQEMMQRSGAAYNSGFWGTGIGGSGSSNKKINQAMNAGDWAAVSTAAGRTIRNAAEFWTLSSKEMYQVMRDANAQWTVIMDKANEGTADAAKFMNEYIELWKQQEELENAYKERWTSVSFDSVKDSFLSALSDMDKSAYDFSEDFTKYLFDAVMNAQVGEMLEKELKGWYDDFSRYMESGAGELTEAEIAALRQRWDSIVKEGVSMRDAISRATGYGTSSEGSATYNAAKSFTQEQGDILNGRLTAIQIAVRENNVIGQQIAASLQQMQSLTASTSEANTAVLEIRNMMIFTNSYLEDMVRYAKATYNDFGEKIDKIVLNTQNL